MALKLGITDHPPYSPNLTPSDFHLFETPQKKPSHKNFQQTQTSSYLSPLGDRHLTLTYSMPGYGPWYHGRANVFMSTVTGLMCKICYLCATYTLMLQRCTL